MEKSRQGRSIVFSRYVDKRTQARPAFTRRTLGWRGMASEAPHFLEKNLSLLGVSLFLPPGKAFLQAQTPEECRQRRCGFLAVPVTHRTQQVGHLGSLVSPKRVGEKFEQVSGRDSLPDLSQIRSMSPGQLGWNRHPHGNSRIAVPQGGLHQPPSAPLQDRLRPRELSAPHPTCRTKQTKG